MNFDPNEQLITEVDNEIQDSKPAMTSVNSTEDGRRGEQNRDSTTAHMWQYYFSNNYF